MDSGFNKFIATFRLPFSMNFGKCVPPAGRPAGRPSRFLTYYFARIFLRQKGPFLFLSTPPLILWERFKELRHSIFTPVTRRHLVVRVIWVQSVFLEGLLTQPRRGGL